MSRSCYSEDYGDDFPGQLNLYRGNVQRSMRSKAGQARLRELRDALVALPVKTLEADIFAEPGVDAPKVCALGAWALAKTGDVNAAHAMVPLDADDHETYEALKAHGWPKLVVLDAVYMNDHDALVYDIVEGQQRQWEQNYGPLRVGRPETAAERYARVLAWVEEQLVPPAGDSPEDR